MAMLKSTILFSVFFILSAANSFSQENEKIEQETIISNNINGNTTETIIVKNDSVTVIKKYKNGKLVEEKTIYENEDTGYYSYSDESSSKSFEEIINEMEMHFKEAFPGYHDSLFKESFNRLDSYFVENSHEIQAEINERIKNMNSSTQQMFAPQNRDNEFYDEEILEADTFKNLEIVKVKNFRFDIFEEDDVEKIGFSSIEIKPNPNNGVFQLHYETPEENSDVKIQVNNENGNMVYGTEVIGNKNVVVDFYFSKMERGHYLFIISHSGKEIYKEMVVE
jgi:hypothetical protein